jgi:hypothetical protein
MKTLPLAILLLLFCHAATKAENVVYALDFAGAPEGDAVPWLKQHGWEFKLGFTGLKPRFEHGRLCLSAEHPAAGLCALVFAEGKEIQGAKHVRLTWGASQIPRGADWEQGINRTVMGVMISCGHEHLPSGLPFGINPAPYFICPFLGDKAPAGKLYTGKLWKVGGRYLCVRAGKPDEVMVSDIDLSRHFQEAFHKPMPGISAIGIQMNTKDTEGPAAAWIRKIEFLEE